MVDDRFVEVVTGDAFAAADGNVGQGDDGDLGRAAADIHDHACGRFGDGEASADGGGHGFFNQEHAAGAGALG